MKHLKKWTLCALILALCLLVTACAGRQSASAPTQTPVPTDALTPPSTPAPTPEPTPTAAPESIFGTIPHSFMFASGVGGWSTGFTLEDDGSFSGAFHDSDMGDADPEKYPNGTVYTCGFSGRFSRPVRVDDCTYSMRIESMELSHPADGTEEIADGVRYIYSGPYGLENAEELLLYLPDKPADELPEEAAWWLRAPLLWEPTEEGTVGLYVIYNAAEQYAFFS